MAPQYLPGKRNTTLDDQQVDDQRKNSTYTKR